VTATGTAKTTSDKKLQAAIDDHSVKINVLATDSKKTTDGKLLVGDAFMGANYSTTGGKASVTVNSEINPETSGKVDAYMGKPGAEILHAVTEDHEAGLISIKEQTSAPSASSAVAADPTSIYHRAHVAATQDPTELPNTHGIIKYFDANGNQTDRPHAVSLRAYLQTGKKPETEVYRSN
jgi:hypothetical protein